MGFVSGQYYGGGGGFFYGTEQVINSLVQNLEPLFRALLGGQDWTGYLLFEKVLLFVLISIITGLVLHNLPIFKDRTHKGIFRLVAIIIGLLGVRNLNYIWIGTVLVQYQVLFVAIAGILPFMIYWYFVKEFDGWIKKAAWIFYAVIYFGLWTTTELEAYASVYLWSALGSLIYAFFIDIRVQQWLDDQKRKLDYHRKIWNQIAETNEKIAKISQNITNGYHPKPEEARKEIEKLTNHRIWLEKQTRKTT